MKNALKRGLRSPAFALFVMVFSAYAYFYQAGGWNQNSRFDLVRANVEKGSSSIDGYEKNTGDKACRGPKGRCVKAGPEDHYYCDKAPGVSWLATPSYALMYWSFSDEKPSPRFLASAAHISTVVAIALPSALAVVAMFWLLLLLGLTRPVAIGVTLGYGLATLAFPYATLLYGHQLTSALLFLAFVALVRLKMKAIDLGPLGLFAIGLSLGMSVVVEYPSAVPVIAMCVYAASFLRASPQKLAWIACGIAIPGLLCAVYHYSLFGGPATLPYEFSTQPHRSQGFFMGLGVPNPRVLKELLFGSYRGLFWGSPWLLVSIPGALLLLLRKQFRAEVYVCLSVVVFLLWLNSSLVDWQGGWAMGPRYLIPTIPFLVVLSVGLFRELAVRPALMRRAGIAIALVLGLQSGYMMLVGTAVKPEVPTHIRAPFTTFLKPHFHKGEIAISTQGIDMIGAPRKAAPKAWNLGQRIFGLSGRASLLPLLLWQLLLLLWIYKGCTPVAASTETQ